MKVRNGFVSNSSSSSFIVLLPKDFSDTIDYDKIAEENGEDFPIDKLKEVIAQFIHDEYMYDEEFYYTYKSDYDLKEVFNELISPYTISSIDTSSDAGCTVMADRNKIQEILDKTK